MLVVQISDPMTGYEDFNRKAFFAAEERLKRIKRVNHVINPAYIEDQATYPEALMLCINTIPDADVIYLLNGWQNSPGAQAEFALAKALRKPFIEEADPEGLAILKEMVIG